MMVQRPPLDWLASVRHLYRRYPLHSGRALALIVLLVQRLSLVRRLHILASFPVSTSRFGSGCLADSLRTPTGVHQVLDKLGSGQPLMSLFRQRRCDGSQARLNPLAAISRNEAICTRIIRLGGLERGHNQGGYVDSYKRFIYIHGTIDEKRVGRPASIGCIRMRNHDVCELYKQLQIGSLVYVIDSSCGKTKNISKTWNIC